jgi:hypothetical protein
MLRIFDPFSGTVRMSSYSCMLAGACLFQSRLYDFLSGFSFKKKWRLVRLEQKMDKRAERGGTM